MARSRHAYFYLPLSEFRIPGAPERRIIRGELSPPRPDAQQSGGRRCRVGERAETGLRRWLAGNAGVSQNRKPEVRVIEHVEELPVDAQLHALIQGEPLGEVEIAPGEIGTAQGVAAQISELAVLRRCRRRCRRRCSDRPWKRMHPGFSH